MASGGLLVMGGWCGNGVGQGWSKSDVSWYYWSRVHRGTYTRLLLHICEKFSIIQFFKKEKECRFNLTRSPESLGKTNDAAEYYFLNFFPQNWVSLWPSAKLNVKRIPYILTYNSVIRKSNQPPKQRNTRFIHSQGRPQNSYRAVITTCVWLKITLNCLFS